MQSFDYTCAGCVFSVLVYTKESSYLKLQEDRRAQVSRVIYHWKKEQTMSSFFYHGKGQRLLVILVLFFFFVFFFVLFCFFFANISKFAARVGVFISPSIHFAT